MLEDSGTNVEIQDEQSAIVFEPNGASTLYVPNRPDEAPMNMGAQNVLRCMVFLQMPELCKIVDAELDRIRYYTVPEIDPLDRNNWN